MAQIEDDVLSAFYADLEVSEQVSDEIIGRLTILFDGGKTPKADALVRAFSDPPEEGLS